MFDCMFTRCGVLNHTPESLEYFYVIQTFKRFELLYATAFPSSDGL